MKDARFCIEYEVGRGWHWFVAIGGVVVVTSVHPYIGFAEAAEAIEDLLAILMAL